MKIRTVKFFIFFGLAAFISAIVFSQCNEKSYGKPDIRGEAYADPATCIKCHKEVNNSYLHTGHYHASSPIEGSNLPVTIKPDSNNFDFNPGVNVAIEKKADGLYQNTYLKGSSIANARFDVAFGSGKNAQTYGYWKDNQLYQLPLSYFQAIHNWANSPGFPNSTVYYGREIVSRCFECHGSFAQTKQVQSGALAVVQQYDKNALLYGIDCQRCHGPAAQHVVFHTDHPDDKKPKFITPYNALTRQQKLDMCSICHSGNSLATVKSTFGFLPGDTASHFYEPSYVAVVNEIDVHGNQYQLLSASKCFVKSAVMTCTTCHNPHQDETDQMAVYNKKCLQCHTLDNHNYCKMAPQLGNAIVNKCIDCHMPAIASKVISYRQSGGHKITPYLLRTHRIAIYPNETLKIQALLQQKSMK